MITRLLAMVCAICPFCVVSRHWPNSKFSRFMTSLERSCPFCRAYFKRHAKTP